MAAAFAMLAMTGGGRAMEANGTQERPFTVATFGTSLTARGGWQKPLQLALATCLRRPAAVHAVALSGSTSAWGFAHVGEVLMLRPDVVLVEFYANDAALNRLITLSASRRNISDILRSLRVALPRARIFGMGMNPIHGWRGWARPFLARFVAAHRAAAEEIADGYIDFGPLWSRLTPDAIADAIPDGSHPRPEVAAAIMVPELVRRLAPDCRPPRSPPD